MENGLITEEQFKEWRSGAIAQFFFDTYLPSRIEQIKGVWAAELESGNYQTDMNALKANFNIRANVLRQVIDADFAGISEDMGLEQDAE